MLGRLPPRTKNRMAVLHLPRASSSSPNRRRADQYGNIGRAPYLESGDGDGAAWARGRRGEAAAGGWTTGEAAAYPGPDGGRRLRSDARVGFGMDWGRGVGVACGTDWEGGTS
jgi:hypothetical protein